MSVCRTDEPEVKWKAELCRSDWIVLPLLSLLTIVTVSAGAELLARRMFPQSRTLAEDCMVFTDKTTGPRGIPNSVCREKIAEGEPTENRFNNCGHRAGMECGRKPPGVYRIVMIGTSMAMGMRVPREKTFAALLPLDLARRTGNQIELYNEAIPYRTPGIWANHFGEVLEAQPDLVLWALSPNDLSLHGPREMLPRELNMSFQVRAWHHIKGTFAKGSFSETVQYAFRHTRTSVLLLDALYSDPRQFVKSSLMASDDNMGYLKAKASRQWQERLEEFNEDAAKVERLTRVAGVPLVVVMLPTHVQADMVTLGEWPEGFDPYKLDRELKAIVTKQGATYVDIMPDIIRPDFQGDRTMQNGYYSLDAHANPFGNSVLSAALAKELTSGAIAALSVPLAPKAIMTARR
jgi:hypothetical protein